MKDRTPARELSTSLIAGATRHTGLKFSAAKAGKGKAPSLRRATMPRRTWSVAPIQHLQIGSARRLRTWSSCRSSSRGQPSECPPFPRAVLACQVAGLRPASLVGRLMRRGRPFAQKCRHRGNELVCFLNRWHMSTLVETDELRSRNSRRITFSLCYRQQLILLPPHH